jgi:UPF0271 protein
VDLNADLGEGFGIWRLGDDDALLATVTSANVACGFHAGDAMTMRRVCERAADRGVAIGAQVAYRDLAGFGRRRIDYHPSDLRDEIIYQIAALDGFCRLAGERVRYVKPHGALYHAAASDPYQATAVVSAIVDYDRSLPLLAPAGSTVDECARRSGVRVVYEAFADRAYRADGTLVPRGEPGAVVRSADAVVARAVQFAQAGEVESVDGSPLRVPAESLCLHGDTPGAADLARRVRDALIEAGVELRPFVELL